MKINLIYNMEEKNKEGNHTLAYAASELAEYLQRMFPETIIIINNEKDGPEAEIRMEVMRDLTGYGLTLPEDADLDDQYVIEIGARGGKILGSNARSVLIGVYQYLYLLGCRFLRPGKAYEFVPVLGGDLPVVREAKAAGLRHRGVCIEGADSLENITDFVDWLPKLGYNCFFLQFKVPYTFMARWYHHELNPMLPPEDFDLDKGIEYSGIVESQLKKRGLMLHMAGHGWTGEVLGYPSVEWKASYKEPTDEARAMMAELDGRRELFHGIPMNTNLCYGNPEAVEAMVRLVADYAASHREVDYLHVWLADEYNNICECEACGHMTPTDQYIRLLNRIDERLEEQGLETRIVFLLYQELLWAPEKEALRNPERFVLMFAPISRTFEKTYEWKDQCVQIPEYVKNHVTLPVNLDVNMAFLRAWQKQFSGDSFVYDYPLGRAHYGDLGYVHISRVISQDIKQLGAMGLNGYISCQELRCFLPNGLPNYVMGRTLFDPSLDFCQLASEYFATAYGGAGESVQRYLDRLSDLSSCDYVNGKGPRYDEDIRERMAKLRQEVISYRPHISAALEESSGVEKLFWKHLDYHGEYSVSLGKALELKAAGCEDEASERWKEFQQYICGREPEFQGCLDVYRVTEVSSKYAGFRMSEELRSTL